MLVSNPLPTTNLGGWAITVIGAYPESFISGHMTSDQSDVSALSHLMFT